MKQSAILTCKATNATLTVCCGFIPDFVKVTNLTDRTALEWSRKMVAVSGHRYGLAIAAAGTRAVTSAASDGVVAYAGGTLITSASTQYLVANDADQKAIDVASGSKVSSFTLGSAANKTGNFNVDVTGAFIGVGSVMRLENDPVVYTITALTAGQGSADNEVTLDASPGDGAKVVTFISSMYEYTGAAANKRLPAGIEIGASATVNDTDGDKLMIEVGLL